MRRRQAKIRPGGFKQYRLVTILACVYCLIQAGRAAPEWGQMVNGVRIGAATEKESYRLGEPVVVRVLLENTTASLVTTLGAVDDGLNLTLIDSKQQLVQRMADFRKQQAEKEGLIVVRRNPRPHSGYLKPNTQTNYLIDLAQEFVYDRPGSYLFYASAALPNDQLPWPKTPIVTSGNVLINIVAAAPGNPGEAGKPAIPASQTNAAPATTKRGPGQSSPTGTGSVTNQPKSAAQEAGVGAVPRSPAGVAQKGGTDSTASSAPGSPLRETTFSRTTVMAFLFALLGFGVLWWMFRGK